MKSRTTRSFWKYFDDLPAAIQAKARATYATFIVDPGHPGLNFEKVHDSVPFYSVRIGLRWRAVGRLEGETITWFWIGRHDRYDRLLDSL